MGDQEAGEEVLHPAVLVHPDADLHIALVLLLDGDELLPGVVVVPHHEGDPLIEQLPRVGEGDGVGVPVKEPDPQLVFQGGDVLADGGLGDGVGGRGLGEAQAFGQGNEILDLLVQHR